MSESPLSRLPALLLAVVLAPNARAQAPTIAEREALADAFFGAPERIRGGTVDARWLDDGSSLWYLDRGMAMFVDPAEGTPRPAARADRGRESMPEALQRWGRTFAPSSERYAAVANGALVAVGGDLTERALAPASDGVAWSLEAGAWSPDATRVAASWQDTGTVHSLPIVDFGRAVETVEWAPYVKAGTPFARSGIALFELPGGARTDVELGPDEDHYLYVIGWREDGAELLFLRLNREATRLDLMGADPATGASRVVLTETSETFVGGLDFVVGGWREVFHPIPGTDRFLWLSERDGWRHAYRYTYGGELLGRVTRGAFPVLRIVAVDAEQERVFLMANAEPRPYDTHLYRAPLEGGELVRLTEGDGEHEVRLSPSRRFFVDTHSSLDRPPVSELRDADGRRICVLAEADVSGLEELGWTPPHPFVAKAADGETDLYGALFLPRDFDPELRYPIVDIIYSGPFMTIVPNEYGSRGPYPRRAQTLAQLGFAVVLLDPRGTTERGKAFQDASYGRIGEIEIPDHVAALRQLAAERPYLDLERVGVYGHSWGGYFALRAMLTAPETFRAGVAGAPGELTEAAPINEPYMRTPANNREGYAAGLNAPLAANLAGELLIIHGTADVNAPFSTSMRMVDALVEADKPFDLLVLPGATHYFQGQQAAYATGRIRSFFLEHLRGERRTP